MNYEYTPSFLEHEHEHIPVLVDEYALRKDVHTYLVGNQYVHVVCSNYMTYRFFNNDDEHIATVQLMNRELYVSHLSNQFEFERIEDNIYNIISIEQLGDSHEV